MTLPTVPIRSDAHPAEVDEDVVPLGTLLVGWFAAHGRSAEAIHVAHAFGLITAEHFEQAFAANTDVLVVAGLVTR